MAKRKIPASALSGRTGTSKLRTRKDGPPKTPVARRTPPRASKKERVHDGRELFRRLYENMLDAFAFIDMEGRLREVNTAFVHLLGYSPKELRTLTFRDLTPEQWWSREDDIIQRQVLPRGHSDIYEKEFTRKDGTTIPVEVRMVILRDAKHRPAGMWALVRDLSSRHEMEERLRLTEEKFTKAFHLSPDAVNINRLSDGVYLAINEGFEKITGYMAAEALGRSSSSEGLGLWVNPADREKLVAGLREYGTVYGLEAPFRMKDGTEKLGLMSARIIHLDNEPCILSVTRDITERKKADEALRVSEERFRRLFETMPDGVYKSTHEGKFLEINPAMVKILGYDSREELMAIDIPSQLYFSPLERESAALEERLEEMAVFRLKRKDGSEVWVEDHGRHVLDPQGTVLYHEGILRDVTERTRTDEMLRASEERMRVIIEGTPQLFFYTQDAQANTTYVSPTVEAITGYAPDVWLKRKDWFITDAGTNRAAREATYARLHGEAADVPIHVEITHRAGHTILLEVYEHAIIRNGAIVGLHGVAHDITQRKRNEEGIVRSLREKEVLLKEIHHRVKNNLQIISSMLNMQAVEVGDSPARAALREAQSRVLSMALIHERLYGVSDFSRVDLYNYSEGLTAHLAQTWRRPGITLKVEGKETFVGVDVAIPCGLIMNELVTNALKHAFTGREEGAVVISVQHVFGGQVQITVQDDGVGFPAGADITGMKSLGMILVMNLVAQIGGTIRLESVNGSRFVVLFQA